MEKITHYFASANTGTGFKNHFEYINSKLKKSYLFILKGGPGTGKSTLLKTVANHFIALGESVELIHCSSDLNSLDGVHLIERNIAIVDGTAPHITETTLPNVLEEIIDLGVFIKDDVKENKKKMLKNLEMKKRCYIIANNYLNSANKIFQNKLILENSSKEFKPKISKFIKDLNLKNQHTKSETRYLFLGSFTSDGIKFLPNSYKEIYLDLPYLNADKFLKELISKLEKLHYNLIAIPNLFDTKYIDSVIIPALNLKITSNNIYNSKDKNLDLMLNNLILLSGSEIEKAIEYHKQVEKYYIKNMDFKGINELTNRLINKIQTL